MKQFFLSHASQDKEGFVRPFARELDRAGLSYWLDEAEIRWGDKIATRIQQGLNAATFVIVFVTPAFIGRSWPEAELSAALTRENSEGRTVVLPVVAGDPRELLSAYPLLRDKQYREWTSDLRTLVAELKSIVTLPGACVSDELFSRQITSDHVEARREHKSARPPYRWIYRDDSENVGFFPYTYELYIRLIRSGALVGLGASEDEARQDVLNQKLHGRAYRDR